MLYVKCDKDNKLRWKFTEALAIMSNGFTGSLSENEAKF